MSAYIEAIHQQQCFEIKSMHIGVGNPDWGAPKEEVFIIKLGELI